MLKSAEKINTIKPSKNDECAYYGKKARITKDHIPPKNIFSKPRPGNLITVPSCIECNREASKDDEYFRNALVMRYDTYEHPDATKNWLTILRSIKRSKSSGLRKAMLSGLKPIDIVTPAGIFIGKSGMYEVDVKRLIKTVNRIIKGIFYFEFRKALPIEYNVHSYLLEQLKFDNEVVKLIAMVKNGFSQTIGKNVFSYWIRKTDEDPNCTISLLVFYKKVTFLSFTVKS
jgi:hypothetical protein